MTLFFTEEKKVNSYNTAVKSDTGRYARFFKLALENSIYLAPSQFEAAFVSFAHTDNDIEKALQAGLAALEMIKTQ